MKKLILMTALGVMMAAMPGMAQQKCSYTPLQEVVRSANSAADIQRLIDGKANLEAPVRCGGTILQLAIVRGNVEALKVLLSANPDVKTAVPTKDFGFPQGVPDAIPVALFAAFRAPNEGVMRALSVAGVDFAETDKNGEGIMWYLEQNPVLRETVLAREIKDLILFPGATAKPEAAANKGAPLIGQAAK